MTLADLTPDEREAWEERAAICQYLGDMTRAEAEEIAWDCFQLEDQEWL